MSNTGSLKCIRFDRNEFINVVRHKKLLLKTLTEDISRAEENNENETQEDKSNDQNLVLPDFNR